MSRTVRRLTADVWKAWAMLACGTQLACVACCRPPKAKVQVPAARGFLEHFPTRDAARLLRRRRSGPRELKPVLRFSQRHANYLVITLQASWGWTLSGTVEAKGNISLHVQRLGPGRLAAKACGTTATRALVCKHPAAVTILYSRTASPSKNDQW